MSEYINAYANGFFSLLADSISYFSGSYFFDILVVGIIGTAIIGLVLSLILRR